MLTSLILLCLVGAPLLSLELHFEHKHQSQRLSKLFHQVQEPLGRSNWHSLRGLPAAEVMLCELTSWSLLPCNGALIWLGPKSSNQTMRSKLPTQGHKPLGQVRHGHRLGPPPLQWWWSSG